MTRRKRELRRTLIEAGTKIISRRGIAALTLRAAGAAAGVSRQAPYHHFRDKEGLLEAIAIAGFARLGVALRAEADKQRSPKDRLVALGVAYVRQSRKNPRMFELLSSALFANAESHPELAAARDKAVAVLDVAMADYLAHHGDPADRTTATAAAWAMAHGLARLLIEGGLRPGENGLPDEDVFVASSLRLIPAGLRVEPYAQGRQGCAPGR